MHLKKGIGDKKFAESHRIMKLASVLLAFCMLVGIAAQSTAYALSVSETNKNTVYTYLVKEIGLNSAAACGVIANIYYESAFTPSRVGDNGTSYGICQWHNDRKSRLISYCDQNGYDYNTLEGQLHYLEYELTTYYPKVLNYLKSVPNTADGAYDAGCYWCRNYEIPKNGETESVVRGNLAKEKYWCEYNPGSIEASYTRLMKVTSPLMYGNDIRYVQSSLKALGYSIDVDGYYGSGTASVITQFQKDSGLTADGMCGKATWTALENAVSSRGGSLRITTQPTDSYAKIGGQVKFTVKASGTGLGYQWQLSDDGGKTWRSSSVKTADYYTTLSKTNVNRKVRCIVTDKYGNKVTSSAAAMKLSNLAITTQPTDCAAKIGGQVKFTVKASGTGLSYQWQLSDDAGKTWRNSSVKTADYYTTLTQTNIDRKVRCIITDKYGSKVTSSAAAMKLSNLAITTQPTDSYAKIGGQVKFTVKASGTGLGYQWQLSDDAGKTWRNSSVKTADYYTTLTSANNGRYVRCVVTDKYGNKVTSKSARMKASSAVDSATTNLAITTQPTDCAAKIGGQVKFTVKANGTGLSYQWQLSDDAGKTWRNSSVKTADYYTTLTGTNNGRYVRCIVTDKNGNKVTSKSARMMAK